MLDREIVAPYAEVWLSKTESVGRRKNVICYQASVYFPLHIFEYDNSVSYFQHLCSLQNVSKRKAIAIWKRAT